MKTLAKIVAGIVVFFVLVLVVVRFTGFAPIGNKPGRHNYPGLWLGGTVVTTPVTDWSFANQYRTDKLETRTWYGIPHSVTTGFVVYHNQLYITSMFFKKQPYPDGRNWVKNVYRDPHVRLKFGDNLYDGVLVPVTDPDEIAAVIVERSKQNNPDALPVKPGGPVMHLFRVLPA